MDKPASRSEYKKYVTSLGNKCAFCADQGDLIIKRYTHWDWVFAAFPYRKYHTMIVPRRHVVNFFDLEESEIFEFRSVLKEAEDIYKKSGLVSKESLFGDQIYYAWRTRVVVEGKECVSHFHLHICPKFESETSIVLTDDAWDIDMDYIKRFI